MAMISMSELAVFKTTPAYETAQEVIQRLYNSGFIHRDYNKRSREDYDFILRNRKYIELMMDFSGFDLIISEADGRRVVYYESNLSNNRIKFKKDYTIILLRCLSAYQTQAQTVSASGNSNAHITAGELLENINILREKNKMDIKTLRDVLYDMDSHQLVSIKSKKKDFCIDTDIIILSSITCLTPARTLTDTDNAIQALELEGKASATETVLVHIGDVLVENTTTEDEEDDKND